MSPLRARLGLDGIAAAVCLSVLAMMAVLVSLGVVGDEYREFVGDPHLAPGDGFWLGTDGLGRDVGARVLQGTFVSVTAGLGAALGTVALGATLGAVAGLRGGWVDRVLVALADAVAAIPSLVGLLAVGFALGAGLSTVAIAIAVTQWVTVFRAVRIESARLRHADFVRASEAMGASTGWLLRAHVLPNLTPLLGTSFGLIFVWAVKAEAVLGYLGLSAEQWPSWGRIMADGGSELARGIWWPVVGAALPLALLVLSVQVLADRLSEDDAG